jgi:hypothetical protein
MKISSGKCLTGAILFGACVLFTSASWGDKTEYDRRSAARYTALFDALDRNADARVTRSEAHGDIDFSARFDDLDIDRDDTVTAAELQRFISQQHPVTLKRERL